MITTILFDLDGTLLPMDTNLFAKIYFKSLAAKFVPYGYEPNEFIGVIGLGTKAMVKNDGTMTNEKAFWKAFYGAYPDATKHRHVFDEFYAEEFEKLKACCGYSPKADGIVKMLKTKGKRVILATNPLFPAVATDMRIKWAGLDKSDFEAVTTFENSCYCKPNLDYYKALLEQIGEEAQNCLMVGNDVGEDMIARELGMKVFLLDDCILNPKGLDISDIPHGGFDELEKFLLNID